MMSSVSYDASATTSETLNPSHSGDVPLTSGATPVLDSTGASMRRNVAQPINASLDASYMYQYVSPPLSTSSSPYATTTRDRVTQPAALPAPSFLDYAAATGQLPYYCPQYLQYPLTEAYQQQALDPSGAYQFLTPTIPLVAQDAAIPQLAPPTTQSTSSRSTPAAAAAVSTAVTTNNSIQKRRLSSPLVQEKYHQQQQVQSQQTSMAVVPTAASAPPVYEVAQPSQGRSLDADGVVNGSFYSALLAADQRQQQQQQFYAAAAAAAAAAASCYPMDLQLYTAPRIAPDPYWTTRQQIAWYSRSHPTPPPQAAQTRDEQQSASTYQDCYYSDLAAALHNMRLCGHAGSSGGGGGGSGVPSERGTYSPIQYAGWAYPTASPSSQTSSSPFSALYGTLGTTSAPHPQYPPQNRHGHHHHHPVPSTVAPSSSNAAAAPRLHQAQFDPEELVRFCPGINPPELDPSLVWRTRYFVIKSNSTRNVMLSIQHGVWCSTLAGNDCLNRAYLSMQQSPNPPSSSPTSTSQFPESTDGNVTNTSVTSTTGGEGSEAIPTQTPPGRVLLFFSVNTSGCFCGVAEMTSPVDKMKQLEIWQDSRWRGAFSVRWIYAKNVPNRLLRHIQVESAENRAVTHLRDTNEILPASKGEEMLQIIHNNW